MVKNKNILSISNLKKSYDDFLALNNINLNLNSGEYVVLLGQMELVNLLYFLF